MKPHKFITLLFCLCTASAYADNLPKIASVNMCADAFLLEIALPEQIIALSYLSHDARLAAHAQKARRFPTISADVEALATSNADLIIVNAYSDKAKRDALTRIGKQVFTMENSGTLASLATEITALGHAIGRAAAARNWLAEFTQNLTALSLPPNTPRPRMLAYQRRGLSIGKGHILDEIIMRAGGDNIMRAHVPFMAPIALEYIITSPADYILLNPRDKYGGRGADMLVHPALAYAFPPEKRLYLDGNLSTCTGPASLQAIRALRAQINFDGF